MHYRQKTLSGAFRRHTYTGSEVFLDDFGRALSIADEVLLAEIYAAREQDIYGVSSDDIRVRVEKHGKPCHYFHTFSEMEDYLKKNLTNGDVLITMGAGNIVNVGEDLLKK